MNGSPPPPFPAAWPPIAGIVLAGGRSRRMGRPKALLPVPPDGQPLLGRICSALAPYCAGGVTVVLAADTGAAEARALELAAAGSPAQPPRQSAVRFARDRFPGAGPLAGIEAGLAVLPADESWAFVLACDMPSLSPSLLARLADRAFAPRAMPPEAVLCPGEPFHALYRRTAAQAAGQALRDGRWKLREWIAGLDAEFVQPRAPETEGFLNLNTPDDYRKFLDGTASASDG